MAQGALRNRTLVEESPYLGFLPALEVHRRQGRIEPHLDAVGARVTPGPALIIGKKLRLPKRASKRRQV